MAKTTILIDYDLSTWEIRRIIHPDDDSEIPAHSLEPGWGRIQASRSVYQVNAAGKPISGLSACADEIQRQTGRRPPNG